jgi:hypothetical protein
MCPTDVDARQKAANEIFEISMGYDQGVSLRGSIDRSALDGFLINADFQRLLKMLNDDDENIRRRIVLALGQWGNDDTATRLIDHFRKAPELSQTVRVAFATALKTIGGERAVRALTGIACNDPAVAVRIAALSSLEELAAGGWVDWLEKQPPGPPRSEHRPYVTEAIGSLSDISHDDNQPDFLRDKAKDTMAYLAAYEAR